MQNTNYGAALKTWDNDMSVYPPRTLATSFSLHTNINKDTEIIPLSCDCALRPSPSGHADREKSTKWPTGNAPEHVQRFTSLKLLVDEVKSYNHAVAVDVQGDLFPFQLMRLDAITIHRPASPKMVPQQSKALVDGRTCCQFAHDCIDIDIDEELGLCKIHSERLVALVGSNPNLAGVFQGTGPSICDLEWALPTTQGAADRFIEVLSYIQTSSLDVMFSIDFEGLAFTRADLATIPTQIGVVNLGTKTTYVGYFKYGDASPDAVAAELATKNAINWKTGWTAVQIRKYAAFFRSQLFHPRAISASFRSFSKTSTRASLSLDRQLKAIVAIRRQKHRVIMTQPRVGKVRAGVQIGECTKSVAITGE